MTKIILTIGPTDGLGKEVSKRLASQAHQVLLHGRDTKKGKVVLSELSSQTNNSSLEYFNTDLAPLSEIKKLPEDILNSQNRLDILVNNTCIGQY